MRYAAMIVIGIFSLLLFYNMAYANDSVTIGVSCTIPEIPGVNAPPFTEDKNTSEMTAPIAQNEPGDAQQEYEEETYVVPTLITEEKIEGSRSGEIAAKKTSLQTVYSR